MAEYIEKEAALKSVRDKLLICETLPDTIAKDASLFTLASMQDSLKTIPAASVRENVTGRWIWDDEGYHCSECLYHAYGNAGEVLTGQFIYCPWCGAKLCEEEE